MATTATGDRIFGKPKSKPGVSVMAAEAADSVAVAVKKEVVPEPHLQRSVTAARAANRRVKVKTLKSLKKMWQAKCKSSLGLHTDSTEGMPDDSDGSYRGQLVLCDASKPETPSLVVVPPRAGGYKAGDPSHKFTILSDPGAMKTCMDEARRVPAPPGSIVVWHKSAVHGNCGMHNTVPDFDGTLVTVAFKDALADISLVHSTVTEYGCCVITGILTSQEAAAAVKEASIAVWW